MRGYWLQRALIKARVRKAREIGLERVQSYTLIDNIHSANNLLACGFRLIRPHYVESDFNYWEKEL